jgi:hypothetical protein
MSTIEHGISIGISRVDNFFFMKIKIKGTLTHEDYERMIPMLKNAIKGVNEPDIRILIDATDLKIVDWNVPEPDDQDASEILVSILEEKLQEIKADVKDGKYK